MGARAASFANFICKFGDSVLLDHALDIVIPAFTDDKLVRGYGDTSYFFLDAKLEKIGDEDGTPILAVCGQFVKETVLRREQIYNETDGLVESIDEMPTAPSAFFILILNNHRLIYYPETVGSPNIDSFRATTQLFLTKKHREFINKLYEIAESEGNKITKKKLYEQIPSPTLNIVSLSSNEGIESFVKRYAILKKVELKLISPNHEIDGAEVFESLREAINPINAKTSSLILTNNEGLDTTQAVPLIKDATRAAIQDVKLSGVDREGSKLVGENDDFKISAPIEPVPITRRGKIKKLLSVFDLLRNNNSISVPKTSNDAKRKINHINEQTNE